MKRSAAWSSSPVVTPGRTLPASRLIVRTRMAPAAAIRSISSGLFLMIIEGGVSVVRSHRGYPPRGPFGGRRSDVFLEPQGGDHRADVVVHVGGAAGAVDALHQALLV